MLDLTLPHDLAEHERKAILAHFQALPEPTRNLPFELLLPGRPLFLIKHDSDILDEAYAQHFFYRLSQNDPLAPQIPPVIDAFSVDGFHFLVMPNTIAPTLKDAGISEEEALGHAALAVKWLVDQTPSVPPSVFGRISPNDVPVWHKFFKDRQAPRAFDADLLLKYVEKAVRRCPGPKPDPTLLTELEASFKARSICHSDINAENFLLDADKKVWIVDFQYVSVLPTVFLTYAFFNTGKAFAWNVGTRLGYQPSAISGVMVKASTLIHQTAGKATLGF